MENANAEDVYTIAFHTCALGEAAVDIDITLVEVNPGPDYLGAGQVESKARKRSWKKKKEMEEEEEKKEGV